MFRTLKIVGPLALVALLLAGLAACGAAAPTATPTPTPLPAPNLSVQDVWARPAAMTGMEGMKDIKDMNGMDDKKAMDGMDGMEGMDGGTGAVYFTLVNEGNAPDALVGARSDVAMTAGLHETQMEGDVMRMVPVPRIEVQAGGRTALKPGGLHVMLVDLKQDLNPGDTVTLILRFEKSPEITVAVEVRQP